MVVHITDKFLQDLSSQLSKKQFGFNISEEAKNALNDIGFDPNMGARSVLRAINTEFKKEISRILLLTNESVGTISVGYKDGKFVYELVTTRSACKEKSLFDVDEKEYDFETAEEAQEYAKNHIGTVIKRASRGVGFIKLKNYMDD
ncbi:MAG: hypothetical protein LRY68_11100 [Sulfurospirillum sp.]|nr:hypothetical protein [Sulfurospirillum sp.]